MENIQIIEIKSEFGAGTRGASLGIDAIKLASTLKHSDLFSKYPIKTIDFTSSTGLFRDDSSNAAKYIDEILKVESKVCEVVSEAAKSHFPIILGGDHSVGAGTLCGMKLANPDKRIGVVWIDAHADLHTPYTTPSGNMHGMPLAMCLATDNKQRSVNQLSDNEKLLWEQLKNLGQDGAKINAEDIIFIGLRDTEAPEEALIAEHGVKVFSVSDVRKNSAEEIVKQSIDLLSDCDIICISFDVDSMDPEKVSWGTGTPVPKGLTKKEAIDLNTGFVSNSKIASWEMVEVNPLLDSENAMAVTAFEVLEAVIACRK